MANRTAPQIRIQKAREAGVRVGRASRASSRGRAPAVPVRATPIEISDWAEERWYGSPKYQAIFKTSDQFVRFVEYMSDR
jgi:hypothetical protein